MKKCIGFLNINIMFDKVSLLFDLQQFQWILNKPKL